MALLFEHRRERVLLGVVGVLLGLLVAAELVLSPLQDWLGQLDMEIARTRSSLREARHLRRQARQVRGEVRALTAGLRGGTEEQQNRFRRHLESLVSPLADVTSSKQLSQSSLPGGGGLIRVMYELQLSAADAGQLRAVLDRIDRRDEPLRVEHLQVVRRTEEGTPLNVRITVSTVARPPKEP